MSPRYAAAAVAKQRAAAHGAALVLSSATPSLESYFFASQGRYRYHELPARFNRAAQPPVGIVDLRDELKSGNTSVLSLALQRELAQNLDAGEQSILFINRRGYNTFVSCRACGYVAKCPSCGIAMTYHLQNNRLMCHYCGHSEPTPDRLPPECGEPKPYPLLRRGRAEGAGGHPPPVPAGARAAHGRGHHGAQIRA